MARWKHHAINPTKLLSPEQIENLALAAVESAEIHKDTMTGAERHSVATDMLLDKLDDFLKWGNSPVGAVLEILDGPALHILWSFAGAEIQRAFDKWQAKHAHRRPTLAPPDSGAS
jgi:hypothetical protein